MTLEIRNYRVGQAPLMDWQSLRRTHAYRNDDGPAKGEQWLAYSAETPLARLSVQGAENLRGLAVPTGLIGHYECTRSDAGIALLQEASRHLREQGKALALGPMHGSTWNRYRLMLPPATVAESGPPFLGEPENPPRYVEEWQSAGFHIRESYSSWSIKITDTAKIQAAGAKAMQALGPSLHPLDLNRFETELAALYDEACESFADNILYSPIGQDEFIALYSALKPMLQPGLVWLVKGPGDRVLGHVLAWAEGPRIVLKNLAVRPSERGGRLGWRLIQLIHAEAARRGATEVIHALTHDDNSSSSISKVYGEDCKLFRRYALFEKDLT